MTNSEDQIIEDYLNPILKDMMDKSLTAISSLLSEENIDHLGSIEKDFCLKFLEGDALQYYTDNKDVQKLAILSDLKHKLSKII